MAKTKLTTDIYDFLFESLQHKVKTQLLNDLMEKELEEYKNKIKPLVEERVKSLVFNNIEAIRDFYEMKDIFYVELKWEKENNE